MLRLTAAALLVLLILPTGAGAARYDRWTSESGADPVDTIRDLDVTHDAISPGPGGGAGRVELQLRSTVAQQLRISVVDAAGRQVATIIDAQVAAGPATYAWDGRRANGRLVPDGSYELVVEAGDAHDSVSVSDIVRVDRRAPTVRLPRRVRLSSRTARSVRLPIVASEAALVDVRLAGAAGRARTSSARPGGRSSLVVPVASARTLRRAMARGRARMTVRVVATDAAGNRTARTAAIEVLPPLGGSTSIGDEVPAGGSASLSWPLTGPITSRFGPRWGRMHNGIDLGVPSGRPIGAAAPGRVTYAGWMSGYGNTVIVDHGRLETLYAHQSRIAVRVGQSVGRGQTLGFVGSTGNSTGPHLHFEVRIGGAAKDPLRYLP